MKEEHICCICHEKFLGYGNNPYPISKSGRCCDECNGKVIAVRLMGINTPEQFIQWLKTGQLKEA